MSPNKDTIFAQCSAKGKAGVTVYRVSGPTSLRAFKELTGMSEARITPRHMYFTKVTDPTSGSVIDEGMAVFFKAESSFTGEDSFELHLHGSLAVVKLINRALLSLDYLRLAEPGEFAQRAFLNGKFDLTAAEGLADLIDAETQMQHTQAIRQLGGGLADLYEGWRVDLLKIMSLIEAFIDFPDEEIPEAVIADANNLKQELIAKIDRHLADNRRGERLRSGLKLAILGRPNVGKSSLLNYLMDRDVAIVSDIAGTTRDVVEGHLDIGGYPIILQDTAGIRNHTSDVIEKIGIDKALKVKEEADIKLVVFDATELENNKEEILDEFRPLIDEHSIVVVNKVDASDIIRHSGLLSTEALAKVDDPESHANPTHHPEASQSCHPEPSTCHPEPSTCHPGLDPGSMQEQQEIPGRARDDIERDHYDSREASPVLLSVKTGQGLDELIKRIGYLAEKLASPTVDPQVTRERHRVQLGKARESLEQFSLDGDLVLAAEDLRMTVRYLSNITGKITVDEVLGEIFSSFCIGK